MAVGEACLLATNPAENCERAALAESWNGSRWTIAPAVNPAGATSSPLAAISCTSAEACTAVGSYTAKSGTQTGLAERWDGTNWTMQDVGSTSGALNGVSCPSPTDCVAVGAGVEAWDGTNWSVQPTTTPASASSATLNAVSCTSASACVAIGNDFAEVWNGISWSSQSTAAGALYAVSCSSADACTATGGVAAAGIPARAESWNGAGWTAQSVPQPNGATGSQLAGVVCSGAADCLAVGSFTTSASPSLPLAETEP